MNKINIKEKYKNSIYKKDNVLNAPIITFIGKSEAFIENYKGIIEYTEIGIKISTAIGELNILGDDLWIKQMNEESLTIYGKLESITYK